MPDIIQNEAAYDELRAQEREQPSSDKLAEAAQAVIDSKGRPGERALLGDGKEDDTWVGHHEVEDSVLDALEAALKEYKEERDD